MASGRRIKKLTKRTVDASAADSVRYIVWDSDLTGFGLRVEPSGRKTFIARYRAGGGRNGRLRQALVGRYGTLTADEAVRVHAHSLGQPPVAAILSARGRAPGKPA